MNVKEQLEIMGKRLCSRMNELKLTPRIIQQRSGLALNSVKTAMTGKKCNVGTLGKICDSMGWTLFDLFQNTPYKPARDTQKVAEVLPPKVTTNIDKEASPII